MPTFVNKNKSLFWHLNARKQAFLTEQQKRNTVYMIMPFKKSLQVLKAQGKTTNVQNFSIVQKFCSPDTNKVGRVLYQLIKV